MLFLNKNKTKVKYFVDTETLVNDEVPALFFEDVEKYKTNKNLLCPAINSSENRVFYIPSFADLTIKTGLKDNEPYYEYEFDTKQLRATEYLHKTIKELLICDVNEKNVFNFQILLPYLFVTDDKELELIVMPPNIETKNLKFAVGGFHIYSWIRHINSGWYLIDKKKEGVINVKKGEPLVYIIFNKSVSLEKTYETIKIKEFAKTHKKIVQYVKNINNFFGLIANTFS